MGIPTVTGMYRENSSVDLHRRGVYIVKTEESVKGAVKAVSTMLSLIGKIAAKEKIGKPDEEGYFPRGFVISEKSNRSAAERAVAMLLAKMKGQPFEPKKTLPKFQQAVPSRTVKDLASAKIALVSDGGLVPKGNPDKLPPHGATRCGSYSFKGLSTLGAKKYEGNHVGYDTTFISRYPNRLISVDVLREFEGEGRIGSLDEIFYTLAGVATTLKNARNLGKALAKQLKSDGVTAVILTST